MGRTLPRFDFRVSFGACTETGPVRTNNEDALLVDPEGALFGVADGMGGAAAGEVAARLSVEAFREALRHRDVRRTLERYVVSPDLAMRHRIFSALRDAASTANDAVRAAAVDTPEHGGMGSTLTAVLFLRDQAFVAHVGDSRVYLCRPDATLQLTHDHTLADRLRETNPAGRVDRQRAHNPLVNNIGMTATQRCDTLFVGVSRGDRLVVCTDGVYGAFATEAAFGDAARTPGAEPAARALIDAAMANGSRDNGSIVVIDVCDRFVTRPDDGRGERDLATARLAPIFAEVPLSIVLRVLAVAVETELLPDAPVPQAVTSDRVTYLLLDGEVASADGRVLSAGGMLYPESLVDEPARIGTFEARTVARALRIRGDDFREVCAADHALASRLYAALARHLARVR